MSHATIDPATIGVLGVPNYTHAVASEGTTRWLHLSGQIGLRKDGTVAAGALDQCHQALANIGALLEAGGMTVEDIVHMRIFLLDRDDIPALRQARGEFLGDPGSPARWSWCPASSTRRGKWRSKWSPHVDLHGCHRPGRSRAACIADAPLATGEPAR